METKLYLSEKYQVILGEESSVALCTCWTDPSGLMRVRDELQQLCQIVGTLYSQEGVSIMLRNLALNPWIRTIALYLTQK